MFEQYCNLLADRAAVDAALEEGLSNPVVEQAYRTTRDRLNSELDRVLNRDGFLESVVDGGDAAATALDELSNPIVARMTPAEELEDVRRPFESRLEVAASLVTEYGIQGPEADHIRATAASVGVTAISAAVFITIPAEVDTLTREEASDTGGAGADGAADDPAETVDLGEVVVTSFAEKRTPVDEFFSMCDAAVLVACMTRFGAILAENGITLPDGVRNREYDATVTEEDLARVRVDALNRLGALMQDEQRFKEVLGSVPPDDPRADLLDYLHSVINGETYALLADLIESSKVLTLTVVSPKRSGVLVRDVATEVRRGERVIGTPAVPDRSSRPAYLRAVDEVHSEADADTIAAVAPTTPTTEGIDATAEPQPIAIAAAEVVAERTTTPNAESEPETFTPDIGVIKAELNEMGAILADVCLAYLLEQRAVVAACGMPLHGEGYPASTMGDLMGISAMHTWVREVRQTRLVSARMSDVRIVTVQEAMMVVLYRHPVLRKFMRDNRRAVEQIIETAFSDLPDSTQV
jgi:hypothetical protein